MGRGGGGGGRSGGGGGAPPGEVAIRYNAKDGRIVLGIEGAIRGRDKGVEFKNSNPRYGQEMPSNVRSLINGRIQSDYTPLARRALAAFDAGNSSEGRRLSGQAKQVLQSIGTAATNLWRQ